MVITENDLGTLPGTEVYDNTGERLGTVGEVYLDPHSGVPLWVTVRTGSFSFQESFVPLHDARLSAGRLTVAVDQASVRRAPLLDTGRPIEAEDAGRLDAHYGVTRESADDDAMTRSEERLVAGTRREPVTRVRLRKYIVTEERQITVPVAREEVRLEQVPVTGDEAAGDAEPEPDPAVVLHEERPVVTTETVPVEKVKLTRQTVRGEESVTGTVRKEKIDYQGPEESRDA